MKDRQHIVLYNMVFWITVSREKFEHMDLPDIIHINRQQYKHKGKTKETCKGTNNINPFQIYICNLFAMRLCTKTLNGSTNHEYPSLIVT